MNVHAGVHHARVAHQGQKRYAGTVFQITDGRSDRLPHTMAHPCLIVGLQAGTRTRELKVGHHNIAHGVTVDGNTNGTAVKLLVHFTDDL